jgi:hypothetical protein
MMKEKTRLQNKIENIFVMLAVFIRIDAGTGIMMHVRQW